MHIYVKLENNLNILRNIFTFFETGPSIDLCDGLKEIAPKGSSVPTAPSYDCLGLPDRKQENDGPHLRVSARS